LKRKAVLIPITLVTVLALSGIAWAAFQALKLHVAGNTTALALTWDSTVAQQGTDTGNTDLDPLTYGPVNATMTSFTGTRDVVAVGKATPSYVSGAFTLTLTGMYPGYKAAVSGLAKMAGTSTQFVVAGIVDDRTDINTWLDRSQCGATVDSTGLNVHIGVEIPAAGPSPVDGAFSVDVQVIPFALYNAAAVTACNAQSVVF
jgi:hypothetical protein